MLISQMPGKTTEKTTGRKQECNTNWESYRDTISIFFSEQEHIIKVILQCDG